MNLAHAEEWRQLVDDEEISRALIDKEVVYANQGNSSQSFSANGDTTFVEGRPSLGQWQARGMQYCSQWPPSNAWTCYDVFLDSSESTIRFRGTDGVNWDGTYQ